MTLLLDTGPWVALLSRNDTHHRWAVEQFRLLPPPFLIDRRHGRQTIPLLSP